jgi:proteasome lid subunit RPN8/RPN11
VHLVLPEAVWENLLDEFARQRPGVERVAFLDGYRRDDVGIVTTVVLPDGTCEPGYYTVTANQMREAGAHFRQYGMQRLAQVHTHGDGELDHSNRDDQMAYSQRTGALSLVLPEYAASRPRPSEGLLHLRTADGWHALDSAEAEVAITVVPSLLDFRRTSWNASRPATRPPWVAVWHRLTKAARSLSRSSSRQT